jgi:hypothetical protein
MKGAKTVLFTVIVGIIIVSILPGVIYVWQLFWDSRKTRLKYNAKVDVGQYNARNIRYISNGRSINRPV